MTNVTFAVAVKHWRICLLNVILVKYFGLILLSPLHTHAQRETKGKQYL